jgi:hypothetical protein
VRETAIATLNCLIIMSKRAKLSSSTDSTWNLKQDGKIPVFTYEDLEIPITPVKDADGQVQRSISADEISMYSKITWPQRSIYHEAMGWPAITEKDIKETEEAITEGERSKEDAQKEIERMEESGEAEREKNMTPLERAEKHLKNSEEPVLISRRKKPMSVCDKVVLGFVYGWADKVPVLVTKEEKEHYKSLDAEERKKWLAENEVDDISTGLRKHAQEEYERALTAEKNPEKKKADWVPEIEKFLSGKKSGGFIGYRTWYDDEDEWVRFKSKADELIKHYHQKNVDKGLDPDGLLAKFGIMWIEDKETLDGESIDEVSR